MIITWATRSAWQCITFQPIIAFRHRRPSPRPRTARRPSAAGASWSGFCRSWSTTLFIRPCRLTATRKTPRIQRLSRRRIPSFANSSAQAVPVGNAGSTRRGHHQLQGHGRHHTRQPCDGGEPAGNAAVWHHVADPWHRAASSRWCDISRQRHYPLPTSGRPFAYHLHDRNDRRGCQPLDRRQRGHAGRPAAEQFAHGHHAASPV